MPDPGPGTGSSRLPPVAAGPSPAAPRLSFLFRNVPNLITLGRIPLCVASFACAVMVLLDHRSPDPVWGFLGELLLILTALTDYFDGWAARRLGLKTKIGALSDQMMDKMVYCIVFPSIAVGVMAVDGERNMPHVVLVLGLCVTMLMRDHHVSFLRVLADRHQADTSVRSVGKLRTIWALPTACILYAYCFTRGEPSGLLYFNALFVWVQAIDVNYLIVLEIILFVINVVSAISYTRAYGPYLMQELCDNDEAQRKRILAIFPNALTLMNAAMGVVAIVLALHGRFHLALVMLMVAAIFDKLDGAAARKLGLVEDLPAGQKRVTLGAILDDVADGISFCLAPAAIAYAYLRGVPDLAPFAPLVFLYTLAGIARLVYFTLDTTPIPGFFKGLPTPAAALFTGGLVEAAHCYDAEGRIMGLGVMAGLLAIAVLMNAYRVPYVHFGRLMSNSRWLTRIVFATMLVAMFSKHIGIYALVAMSAYLLSPLFKRAPRPETPT